MLLVLFYVSTVRAGSMDLSQAIETALHNSPEVQRSKSALEEQSWKRVEAFSTYLPRLSAGLGYLTNYKYALMDVDFGGNTVTVPQILPTTAYNLQLEYGLFDGFASTDRYRAARAFERSSEKEYDWTRFQVERQVALQFYKTLASHILKNVADQNLKTLEDHLREVELFKKAGISTNYDILRVEVQVSEARSETMNAGDNIDVAQGQLAEVLGQEDSVETIGELPVLKPDLVDKVEASFVHRADLASLQEKVDGLKRLDSADSKHWVPRVSLMGTYQYYNNRNDRFNDHDAFRDAYQVGLYLTWNLFDGLASTAKAHESFEKEVQAEKSMRAATLKAKQDVQFWKRKFVYYCNVYKSRLNDIEKSKESVRLAREGRRVGARTNTDLLDAEAELYRAQASAVNAQLGSIEALIRLELATGQKYSNFN